MAPTFPAYRGEMTDQQRVACIRAEGMRAYLSRPMYPVPDADAALHRSAMPDNDKGEFIRRYGQDAFDALAP